MKNPIIPRMAALRAVGIAVVLLLPQLLQSKTPSWPAEIPGIEGDSNVVYGTLENGIRWAYLPIKSFITSAPSIPSLGWVTRRQLLPARLLATTTEPFGLSILE